MDKAGGTARSGYGKKMEGQKDDQPLTRIGGYHSSLFSPVHFFAIHGSAR
jgi:hypothetical protein